MANARRQQVSASTRFSFRILNYQPDNFTNTNDVGTLSVKCAQCGALKFEGDTESFCCLKGNVQLESFPYPQPLLLHLYEGTNDDSRHFLANIRKYNCAFQMTSFGCNKVTFPGFNPSFKIQGSGVPSYWESLVSTRCQIVGGLRSDIVSSINRLLHNDNHL